MRSGLLALAIVALAASSATGQVSNPTIVQFAPSADHDAVTPTAGPVVVRYELRIYLVSNLVEHTRTIDIGKPTVGSDGTCQVVFAALTPYPLPDGIYQARVVAIGQKGEGPSDLSNVFTFGVAPPPVTTPPPMKPTGITIKAA